MEGNVKKVLSGVGFYGTLAVCLTIVGVCGWLLLSDRQEPAVEAPVTPQVPVSQPVKMPERAVETPVETLKPAPVEETPEPEPADTAPVAAEAPRLTVDPLQGEVLTAFSMEELVYNPALGDWRTHDGVDIAAPAGTAVLGAAYAVYRVAFYQKPTTKVPSPADMPTRECYRKAMGPDADALARDMFKAVHITAQDGTPLAARYYHHADGAPLAIIFHGYRGYAERDGLGGYTLCTALGYNVLLPDQRAHGYSGGHTITMGVKERYDARDWTVWARSRFGPEVPIFLMGVSMGAATVLLAAGLNLPDNVCGIVADCGYTSPREITRKCLPEYLPGMPLELTYAVGRLGAILFGHFDPEDADCEAAAAQSKVPILFVHGDADGFVPYDMGKRNYEACRAKGKKFLTVHGAEHAVSYYHDNDAYTKQATEFLQDCLARRGFVWPPETDEPEK